MKIPILKSAKKSEPDDLYDIAQQYSETVTKLFVGRVFKAQLKTGQFMVCTEISIRPTMFGNFIFYIKGDSFLPTSRGYQKLNFYGFFGSSKNIEGVMVALEALTVLTPEEQKATAEHNKELYNKYRGYKLIQGKNEFAYVTDPYGGSMEIRCDSDLITNYDIGIQRNEIDFNSIPLLSSSIDYSSSESMAIMQDEGSKAYEITDELIYSSISRVMPVFLLSKKEWAWTLLDREYKEVNWPENLIDKVIINKGTKDLIYTLCASDGSRDVDFIDSKGSGLVFLFAGTPGVGKTFLAEAIASTKKAPLLNIASGDLGSHSNEIEQNLKRYMAYAESFKGILLIDEADVFMQTRDKNFEINAIVSLFLKTLEYYSGVIILTTNLIKTIDPAFQSRIDLVVRFEELTLDTKKEIIVNLADNAKLALTDATTEWIAGLDLNGREIKNIIKLLKLSNTSDDSTLRNIFEAQLKQGD